VRFRRPIVVASRFVCADLFTPVSSRDLGECTALGLRDLRRSDGLPGEDLARRNFGLVFLELLQLDLESQLCDTSHKQETQKLCPFPRFFLPVELGIRSSSRSSHGDGIIIVHERKKEREIERSSRHRLVWSQSRAAALQRSGKVSKVRWCTFIVRYPCFRRLHASCGQIHDGGWSRVRKSKGNAYPWHDTVTLPHRRPRATDTSRPNRARSGQTRFCKGGSRGEQRDVRNDGGTSCRWQETLAP